MKFLNATPGNARLLTTTFGPDHMLAAVIARPVFHIEGERLIPEPAIQWPIQAAPAETRYGQFPADVPFLTGGIDLFVVGSAWQHGGGEGQRLAMDVRVGDAFHRQIAVIGDRQWIRLGENIVASDPAPFCSMPLRYEYAYGGKVQTERGEMTWPANPVGKGFYLNAEQAAGQPLPNLEDPAHPITSFEDRPDPVATAPYPAEGSARALNALELDLTEGKFGIRRIKPTLFNYAHPRMILAPGQAKPGDLVEVTHALPEGALRFTLPDLGLTARVELEERSFDFPLHLDQICIFTAERKVFLSYRTVFKYRLVKGERRTATLRQGVKHEEDHSGTAER
jgi:hypothetical protein